VAKIGALSGIIMGLVWGIFYRFIAVSMMGRSGPVWTGAVSGVVILIIMPVVGALTGFIMGAVHAFLYNVFAGRVGGINGNSSNKAEMNAPACAPAEPGHGLAVVTKHFHAPLNLCSYSPVSTNRAWNSPAALRPAIIAAMNGFTSAAGLPACSGPVNRSGCNARDAIIR